MIISGLPSPNGSLKLPKKVEIYYYVYRRFIMIMKAVNISQLDFKNWNNIYEGKEHVGRPLKKISGTFSRTYFYYDKKMDVLYAKNFNVFERILHIIFGYQSKFNRENLWEFFKARHWVQPDVTCPSRNIFRKIAGERFGHFCELKQKFFEGLLTENQSIELFQQGLDINAYPNEIERGYTALNAAIDHGQTKLALLLINLKADVNPAFDYVHHASGLVLRPPLSQALFRQNWQVALALLANNANVNTVFDDNVTPLHCAIGDYNDTFKVNYEVVEELLKRGANIDAADKNGRTALRRAVDRQDQETIQFLLSKGAKR
jgi:Ankyrin repeats (3 copies)